MSEFGKKRTLSSFYKHMMPWYLGNSSDVVPWGGIGLLMIWSGVWTALSLWHAAQRKEHWWFIFFFLVHTAGIVEFIYLYFIAKAFASEQKRSPRKRK